MNTIGDLIQQIAAATDPNRRAQLLVLGLAGLVKSTSNDQNVQRLARDLSASAEDLASSVVHQKST